MDAGGANVKRLTNNVADYVNAAGGDLKRLTAGPKFDGWPAFSPDGTKLAFESNRSGNYEIYVMSLR